jgi:mono/diheme cytochrome c family protein
MSRTALNTALLLAFLAILGLNWAFRSHPAQPNREFLPEMVRTPRYNAYAANPNFPDGKTLQLPVPGTIPRGLLPLHFAATSEDAIRAGNILQNPNQPGDARAIARGAVVFSNFCQPCHGPGGRGDGLVVQRGFPAPPSLSADNARKMKDGQFFHILSFGQKNMPSYAAQIAREDRWNVIAFVRSIQNQAVVPTAVEHIHE